MSYNPPLKSLHSLPDVFNDTQLDAIADQLHEKGWLILDDFLPSSLLNRLVAELIETPDDDLTTAGIGRSDAFEVNSQIRKDKIRWIEASTPGQAEYLLAMESLRNGLNCRLFMGLFDYEAHFAKYEAGAFYKTHRDAFRGQKNRILTTVLYLNETWDAQDGGELVLYNDDEATIGSFQPAFGRLVIFLSEEFPHEVRPTRKQRLSIAGWFRANQSTADRVDPPK